jgi:hypothetical protein
MPEEFVTASHVFAPVDTRVIYFREPSGFLVDARRKVMHEDIVPIVWLREVEAFALVYFKKRCIREFSKFTDYGGLFASIENATDDAERIVEEWEIDAGSELEVIVAARMNDIPTLGYSHDEYNRKQYRALKSDALLEFSEKAQLGKSFSNETFHYDHRKWVQPYTHGLTTIWSSFWTGTEKAEKLEAFKIATRGDPTNRTTYPDDDIDIRE